MGNLKEVSADARSSGDYILLDTLASVQHLSASSLPAVRLLLLASAWSKKERPILNREKLELKILLTSFYFISIGVLAACMSMYHEMHMYGACQKAGTGSPSALQMATSCQCGWVLGTELGSSEIAARTQPQNRHPSPSFDRPYEREYIQLKCVFLFSHHFFLIFLPSFFFYLKKKKRETYSGFFVCLFVLLEEETYSGCSFLTINPMLIIYSLQITV